MQLVPGRVSLSNTEVKAFTRDLSFNLARPGRSIGRNRGAPHKRRTPRPADSGDTVAHGYEITVEEPELEMSSDGPSW